jgi:hypothetical protein
MNGSVLYVVFWADWGNLPVYLGIIPYTDLGRLHGGFLIN